MDGPRLCHWQAQKCGQRKLSPAYESGAEYCVAARPAGIVAAMPRPRIEVTRLGKSYGPVAALTEVSLTAAPGAVLGVLGHNGAGKTTLIDILATRALPTSGTARV